MEKFIIPEGASETTKQSVIIHNAMESLKYDSAPNDENVREALKKDGIDVTDLEIDIKNDTLDSKDLDGSGGELFEAVRVVIRSKDKEELFNGLYQTSDEPHSSY